MKKTKFTILGGDLRNVELAYLLKMDGNEVEVYGFDKLDLYLNQQEKLHESIFTSDVIVGPLPISEDSKMLNAPFFTGNIQINDILYLLSRKQVFTAGKISNEFQNRARDMGLNSIDYFDREEMQALNAVPTAEGAIQVAMENMDITLHSSNALILGYGRIGKTLSRMLYGLGANVYVEARDYGDLAWIENFKYKPVHLKDLEHYLSNIDVIFNTIPHVILDEYLLSRVNKDIVIINIASSPGGIDLEVAKELGLKVISAKGLPGKVAPVTAARIIKDTVYNILDELEK
ncbi:dipicolinate synthase subunit DpsA [Tissierella sp. Yu-01]|uniref:dipicolinate synthase subunit DpsA n=1 Tax=Tissierella sp. Yu-01 TaxID=3035694 RepID=UPI00240E5613|nr:dipicolinate synthase subunit DpsA [Tissierella sp. Yu-01]WFA10142.1 dipicolinate synthase subunit DpsA [Tissierella sp. Yu-01]